MIDPEKIDVPVFSQYPPVPGEAQALSNLLTLIRTVGVLPKAGALYFNSYSPHDETYEDARAIQWSRDADALGWLGRVNDVTKRER